MSNSVRVNPGLRAMNPPVRRGFSCNRNAVRRSQEAKERRREATWEGRLHAELGFPSPFTSCPAHGDGNHVEGTGEGTGDEENRKQRANRLSDTEWRVRMWPMSAGNPSRP